MSNLENDLTKDSLGSKLCLDYVNGLRLKHFDEESCILVVDAVLDITVENSIVLLSKIKHCIATRTGEPDYDVEDYRIDINVVLRPDNGMFAPVLKLNIMKLNDEKWVDVGSYTYVKYNGHKKMYDGISAALLIIGDEA